MTKMFWGFIISNLSCVCMEWQFNKAYGGAVAAEILGVDAVRLH